MAWGYTGSRLDYQLVQQDDAVKVSGLVGTDLLRNIDILSFADGVYVVCALYAPGFAVATGILASSLLGKEGLEFNWNRPRQTEFQGNGYLGASFTLGASPAEAIGE